MQNDIFEMRILIVPVRAPAPGFQVNFHVARVRRFIADLHYRAAKIRPAFAVQKSGMKNSQASAVQCRELLAQQALVSPDRLQ